MMEEEEETLFDQEGLLSHGDDVSQEKRDRKHRIMKTAALSMAFFCLGLCISIPGPTLLDLGERVKHDVGHMTFIFTARAIGYLIGSVVGGILFDFYDQQILLFYTMALTGAATAGIPFCTALLTLSVLIGMQGVAIGVLDTGGNVFCIKIWGKKSAPFLQVLHFAFGIGAFLAPVIARPFLTTSGEVLQVNSTGDYYPVNFKADPFSHSHRSVRDISSLGFWQYTGNTFSDLQNEADHRNLRAVFGESYALSPNTWNRLKRDVRNASDTQPDNTQSLLINGTSVEDFDTRWNLTSLPTTTLSTTLRPKKPDVVSGGELSPKHADAEVIKEKLEDLKKNPVKEAPKTQEETTTSTTALVPDFSAAVENITNAVMNVSSDNSTQNETDSGQSEVLDGVSAQETTAVTTSPAVTTTTTATTPSTTTTTTSTTTSTPTTTTSTTTTSTSSATTTTSTTASTTTTVTLKTTTAALATNPTASSTSTKLQPPKSSTVTSSLSSKTENVSKPAEALDVLSVNSSANGTDPDTEGIGSLWATLGKMSTVQIAYQIIAVPVLANACIFLVLYWMDHSTRFPLYSPTHEDLTRPRDSKCFQGSILVLLFFFFLFYVGMEVTTGGLLPTFATYHPEIISTTAEAANVATLFWGCIALGRFIAIFIARCFKPPCMMVSNLCLTVAGALVFSFGMQAKAEMLWVGTVMLGLGMSSMFPTAISWADTYYPLTGKATAVFVTGSGFGEMTIPILTGYLFDSVDRMSFTYMILSLSIVLSVLYVVLQIVVCRKNTGDLPRSRTGFMRLENSEDMADAMDMGMVEISEGSALGLSENLGRRPGQVEENGKQNNEGYEVTEFTKLVELSD